MESLHPMEKWRNSIDNRGEGAFLISYKVDDLSKAMQELKGKNVKLIDREPRELFGTRYAFVHHPNKLHGVLTELLEGDFDINQAINYSIPSRPSPFPPRSINRRDRGKGEEDSDSPPVSLPARSLLRRRRGGEGKPACR